VCYLFGNRVETKKAYDELEPYLNSQKGEGYGFIFASLFVPGFGDCIVVMARSIPSDEIQTQVNVLLSSGKITQSLPGEVCVAIIHNHIQQMKKNDNSDYSWRSGL